MKNSRRKIGFDFDKVFVNYPPFVPDIIINRLYKKKMNHNNSKKNGVLSYRIPGLLEIYIRQLSHLSFLRHPINDNIEALKLLSKKNTFEIYLISSRFSFLKQRTNDWIYKHNISTYFKNMFFNYNDEQPHVFKNRVIQKLKLSKFIDDDLDLLIYLAHKNPSVKFYWLNNKGQKHVSLPENIVKITSLSELLDKHIN